MAVEVLQMLCDVSVTSLSLRWWDLTNPSAPLGWDYTHSAWEAAPERPLLAATLLAVAGDMDDVMFTATQELSTLYAGAAPKAFLAEAVDAAGTVQGVTEIVIASGANLAETAMRGTDGAEPAGAATAALTAYDPPTAEEMTDALAAVQDHGDETWGTATGFEPAGAAAAALTAYDPPTAEEMTDALAAVQDHGDETWGTATGFEPAGAAAAALTAYDPPTAEELTDALAALQTHGDANWATSIMGDKLITVTVTDDDDDAIGSCPVLVCNAGGQRLAVGLTHSSSGVIVLRLDEADGYEVTLGPVLGYTFDNPYTLDVGSDAEQTATLEGTVLPLPAGSDDPALCRVYCYIKDEGARPMTRNSSLCVTEMISKPAGAAALYGVNGNKGNTDSDGYAYVDVIRGARATFEARWPNGNTKTATITVPTMASYNAGLDMP